MLVRVSMHVRLNPGLDEDDLEKALEALIEFDLGEIEGLDTTRMNTGLIGGNDL